LLLAALATTVESQEPAQEPCRARLAITIDDEIPDARNPSFLSGLLGNPRYRLTWLSGDTSSAVYELSGPSDDPGCGYGIEQIRRDASVLGVQVLEPDAPPG
jgi:hypothetical protein